MNMQIIEYMLKPRRGLILITVGAAHGMQYTRQLNPERVESNKSRLHNKFNPFRVAKRARLFFRGLHPRLLILNPFGVITERYSGQARFYLLKQIGFPLRLLLGNCGPFLIVQKELLKECLVLAKHF